MTTTATTKLPRRRPRAATNNPDNAAIAANLVAAGNLLRTPLTPTGLADLQWVTPGTAGKMLDGAAIWNLDDIYVTTQALGIPCGAAFALDFTAPPPITGHTVLRLDLDANQVLAMEDALIGAVAHARGHQRPKDQAQANALAMVYYQAKAAARTPQ